MLIIEELGEIAHHLYRSATLYFKAPIDTPAYYYLTMSVYPDYPVARPCLMGTICADHPDEEYSIQVMLPKTKIDNEKYKPHLKAGVPYKIYLNRITKEVYDFRRAYDNMLMFSTSPFISADQSLPTNIIGGYGVWSPQGVSSINVSFNME